MIKFISIGVWNPIYHTILLITSSYQPSLELQIFTFWSEFLFQKTKVLQLAQVHEHVTPLTPQLIRLTSRLFLIFIHSIVLVSVFTVINILRIVVRSNECQVNC